MLIDTLLIVLKIAISVLLIAIGVIVVRHQSSAAFELAGSLCGLGIINLFIPYEIFKGN